MQLTGQLTKVRFSGNVNALVDKKILPVFAVNHLVNEKRHFQIFTQGICQKRDLKKIARKNRAWETMPTI